MANKGILFDYVRDRFRNYPKEVTQGWGNLGLRLTGRGSEATPIGSLDRPVAESVGGLSITPAMWGKAVGKGFGKIRKGFIPYKHANELWPDVADVRKIGNVGKVLPKKVLKNIRELKIKPEIKNPFKDSTTKRWTKGRTERWIGQKESDITLTSQASTKTATHEPIHSYVHSISEELSPQGFRANLMNRITDNINTTVEKRIARGTLKEGSDEAFSLYKTAPSEEHAVAMTENVFKQTKGAIKKYGKKELKKGKLRISDDSWAKLSDVHTKKVLAKYAKLFPSEYNIAKKQTGSHFKKEYLIKQNNKQIAMSIKKSDEKAVDKLFNKYRREGTIRKSDSISEKRFPNRVSSHQEATKLGTEYPTKELNRVMLKEEKLSKEYADKAFKYDVNDPKFREYSFKGQEHSLRKQGARETLESKFVTGKKGIYGETPFKPAEFKAWLSSKLSR